jgi:hypothetical protein
MIDPFFLRAAQLRSRLPDGHDPWQAGQFVEFPGGDGALFHQVASHGNGRRTGLNEGAGRFQRDPADRNQLHLRERRQDSLEVGRPSKLRREDLYEVRAGLPGRQDLRRREGARDDDLAVAPAHFDDLRIQRGRHDELGSGQDRRPGGLRVEDRPGAQQEFVAELLHGLPDDLKRVGRRHGELNRPDAAGADGAGYPDQVLRAIEPNDRDDTAVFDPADVIILTHF